MEILVKEIEQTMESIQVDIRKNSKAAEARVRKNSLVLAQLMKQYRKESIAQHKA